jgi:hypothetical protein
MAFFTLEKRIALWSLLRAGICHRGRLSELLGCSDRALRRELSRCRDALGGQRGGSPKSRQRLSCSIARSAYSPVCRLAFLVSVKRSTARCNRRHNQRGIQRRSFVGSIAVAGRRRASNWSRSFVARTGEHCDNQAIWPSNCADAVSSASWVARCTAAFNRS